MWEHFSEHSYLKNKLKYVQDLFKQEEVATVTCPSWKFMQNLAELIFIILTTTTEFPMCEMEYKRDNWLSKE
jgi:hypothetical protein